MVKNNLLHFRQIKGDTQEQLAQSLRVTRQTVIAIEKGNYTPSIFLALKIAEYFKKPVEDIFSIDKR